MLHIFLLLTGILMFTGSISAQTINGCADKATGALRRITPPATCKNGESPIIWSVQGPQGAQGPQGQQGVKGDTGQTGPQGIQGLTGSQGIQGLTGPQGIQGVPGTSSPRQITVATGIGDFELMPCSDAIRSTDFVKQSETSRLRITYHDQVFVESSTDIAAFNVQVNIDGAAITPIPLGNSIHGATYIAGDEFTAFGYAYGISAGAHSLTTRYKFGTYLPPAACVRLNGYTIEIEEIP